MTCSSAFALYQSQSHALPAHTQASLESDRQRILAEIEADVGATQLSLSIKEALVSSADFEAQEALAYAEHCKVSDTETLDGAHSADAAALSAADACAKADTVASAAGA